MAFLGACITNVSPLRAVQMLWINLVMDTLAALALATEPPNTSLLDRSPYGRTTSLISPRMGRCILAQSVYQLTVLLLMFFLGHLFLPGSLDSFNSITIHSPPSELFTMIFNTFLLMTLFNEINCRRIHGETNVFAGIHKHTLFYLIWIGTLVVQIILVSFGGKVFLTVPLSIIQWVVCFGLAISVLVWHQLILFVEKKIWSSKEET